MKNIKVYIIAFWVDVIFWLFITAVMGLVFYFYSGKNPIYFWTMFVIGFFAGFRNLVLCILMVVDLCKQDKIANNMVVTGKQRYWINKPFIKWINQEKPFYYTLFMKDPIVPYLLDLKSADGHKISLVFSLPRKVMEDNLLKVNEIIHVVYLRRSRIVLSISK
jgi:hypothetical protein